LIYHLAAKTDWERRGHTYAPVGWRKEGFIHCSSAEQVGRVADRHYAGRTDLVLLTIAPDRLSALLVWEDTGGAGEDFPHVYGPIDLAAVIESAPFPPGLDGSFSRWTPEA